MYDPFTNLPSQENNCNDNLLSILNNTIIDYITLFDPFTNMVKSGNSTLYNEISDHIDKLKISHYNSRQNLIKIHYKELCSLRKLYEQFKEELKNPKPGKTFISLDLESSINIDLNMENFKIIEDYLKITQIPDWSLTLDEIKFIVALHEVTSSECNTGDETSSISSGFNTSDETASTSSGCNISDETTSISSGCNTSDETASTSDETASISSGCNTSDETASTSDETASTSTSDETASTNDETASTSSGCNSSDII